MQRNKIIIITGSTASGKSTVAKLLCKEYSKCVRLDVDRVKHFVESGFKYNETKEGKAQWYLCTKNIVLLAKNYLKNGYVVVIEGVLRNQENWQIIFEELKPQHKFLLLADKKYLYLRNSKRDKKFKMLKKDIDEHIKEFGHNFYHKYFTVVNNIDLEKTVDYVSKVCRKS
jgi:adenylylsulfate kinase-like enzyme